MRRRIKKRVYVAIAILIIVIVILCRACSAITKDHTNETNETRTTPTTSVTTSTAEAEEVKQVETADESKMEAAAKDEAETVEVEESSEAEKIMQFTVDDPDATELRAYLGERPANMQEIPTYHNYVTSQEKAWQIDFIGTKNASRNDPRRLYFKVPIEAVTMEYESNGVTKTKELEVEELDSELYRVTPPYSTQEHIYMTFEIVSDGETYYMTWVAPPIE